MGEFVGCMVGPADGAAVGALVMGRSPGTQWYLVLPPTNSLVPQSVFVVASAAPSTENWTVKGISWGPPGKSRR